VKLSEVNPFTGMLAAPNALLITGGATTVMEALDVFPVPPSVADTAPVVLFFTPPVAPVTFNETVHAVLIASVPADKLTTPDPGTAVDVPPHVLARLFGVATTRPAGRLSVKANPFRGIAFAAGFVMVRVKDVDPLSGIEAAPNAFTIAGGAATARFAVALFPVPPFVDETLDVVLTLTPAIVPRTLTASVQLEPMATVPPVKETLPEPARAVGVPPHVLARPFGVATTTPAGKLSVNATPAWATAFAAGFVIVKVKLVVPFNGIPTAPNAFAIDGGATTSMLAEAGEPAPPSVDAALLVVLF
jgi:hypothetical protein